MENSSLHDFVQDGLTRVAHVDDGSRNQKGFHKERWLTLEASLQNEQGKHGANRLPRLGGQTCDIHRGVTCHGRHFGPSCPDIIFDFAVCKIFLENLSSSVWNRSADQVAQTLFWISLLAIFFLELCLQGCRLGLHKFQPENVGSESVIEVRWCMWAIESNELLFASTTNPNVRYHLSRPHMNLSRSKLPASPERRWTGTPLRRIRCP